MALTATLSVNQTVLPVGQVAQASLAIYNPSGGSVVITVLEPTINPSTAALGTPAPVPSVITAGQTLTLTWGIVIENVGTFSASAVLQATDGTNLVVTPVLITSYSPAQPVPTYVGNFIGTFFGTGLVLSQYSINVSDVELFAGATWSSSWSYAASYSSGLLNYETWTDTATGYLRKRIDYTYSSGTLVSIRTRIYSIADGVTVTCDGTETYTYTGQVVTSSTMLRTI